MAKKVPALFAFEREKDGSCLNSTHLSGFSKYKNLYITGHSNGAINFWDVSCPLFLPLITLIQQVTLQNCIICSVYQFLNESIHTW